MKYLGKYFTLALLGAATFLATLTVAPHDAEALVCARGVYRAGCAGPRGAVVAPRAVYRAPVYRGPARIVRTQDAAGFRRRFYCAASREIFDSVA